MTVTFKAVVIPGNKHQDGTYPVKIRVTFKGKVRRLPTTLSAKVSDLTRQLKIKSPTILEKTADLIARMRSALEGISVFQLEDMDVDDIVGRIRDKMKAESFRLDFFEFADGFLKGKKYDTARAYVSALSAFARFLGTRTCDINAITRTMAVSFADFVKGEEWAVRGKRKKAHPVKDEGSAQRYVAMLAHIHRAARLRYNDEDGKILIPRTPFENLALPRGISHGQRNLGEDVIRKILTCEEERPGRREALDAFAVSFLLMGANMADLVVAKHPTGGVWKYQRAKTSGRRADGAEMKVDVPPEILPFAKRLGASGRGWWFPHLRTAEKAAVTMRVNYNLKQWAEEHKIPAFTFYAARHSWASIGRSIGIEKATIDDGLCHVGDYSIADIYAEKAWPVINAANRKIIDHVLQK